MSVYKNSEDLPSSSFRAYDRVLARWAGDRYIGTIVETYTSGYKASGDLIHKCRVRFDDPGMGHMRFDTTSLTRVIPRPGDWVRVVLPGDEHDGHMGQVSHTDVAPLTYTVRVATDHDTVVRRTLFHDQVVAVQAPPAITDPCEAWDKEGEKEPEHVTTKRGGIKYGDFRTAAGWCAPVDQVQPEDLMTAPSPSGISDFDDDPSPFFDRHVKYGDPGTDAEATIRRLHEGNAALAAENRRLRATLTRMSSLIRGTLGDQ